MTCPICAKPTQTEWRPFCSRRCADVDLARWLGEGYRIPALDEDEAAAPVEPPARPPAGRSDERSS
ncbi:DNA gyrase inhibitor YacG [Pseudogemmobacter sonorensis]|uniref:DNA gyrase inhibitor YacG n=1 Tax=Pseudogemmobacter sonorensis TaxID=2989681 RepID=UPI0036A3D89C